MSSPVTSQVNANANADAIGGELQNGASANGPTSGKPNIVLIMADNLGWGELGCYGGGALRGAPTPRIDALAKEGIMLHNYNVEGLDPSETTLAELLKGQGYATAHYGKWHLGDVPGRFPSDRGFDHWYGISRTTNESMFMGSLGFDPSCVELPYLMEGRAGEPSCNVKLYDIPARRNVDAELADLSIEFMKGNVEKGQHFFLYLPLVHLHFPTLPHPDFAGRTGNGDFADSMVEMDHRVGQIVDAVKELGIEDNTVLIFCSEISNGPEFRSPYRGTAGPFIDAGESLFGPTETALQWTGTYHTAMEGSLRVPYMMRWPGRIPSGVISNDIVHCTDIFTTLALLGGATLPTDRLIDGVDQMDFFTQKQLTSNREGFLFYIKDELRAIKWRNWKLHFYWQPQVDEGIGGKLESPRIFNLITDPKEETNIAHTVHWMLGPMLRMRDAFWKSPAAVAPPMRVQPLPPAPAAGYC
ncbi:LOW QUALITY PROTEIN: hypothetical protein JCM24511_09302 [Saitozyma sp. JCM 24511]|nr:LOW QUALITY PROTEIN: hypothetical protein JCM24511_09302 [Saitozyma sp. JCM 24511]